MRKSKVKKQRGGKKKRLRKKRTLRQKGGTIFAHRLQAWASKKIGQKI